MPLTISTEFAVGIVQDDMCSTPPPTGLALSEQALCRAPSKGCTHEARSPPSPGKVGYDQEGLDTRTQTLAPRFASRTRSQGAR